MAERRTAHDSPPRQDVRCLGRLPAPSQHLRNATRRASVGQAAGMRLSMTNRLRPALLRPEARPASATGVQSRGATAVGALAAGAFAAGAVAIGRLAIRRAVVEQLTVRGASLGRVEIDELGVRRLRVVELEVERELSPPRVEPPFAVGRPPPPPPDAPRPPIAGGPGLEPEPPSD
jgi:hypothetical protein